MTDPMISPDLPPSHEAVRTAEHRASVTELMFGRRAAEDLVRDREDRPVTLRHGRERDLSTPAGRVRYGYLGERARNALAELLETLDEVDTAVVPLGLVASREAVRQALRLSAMVDDQPLTQCPTCTATDDAVSAALDALGQTLRSADAGRAPAIESMRGQL